MFLPLMDIKATLEPWHSPFALAVLELLDGVAEHVLQGAAEGHAVLLVHVEGQDARHQRCGRRGRRQTSDGGLEMARLNCMNCTHTHTAGLEDGGGISSVGATPSAGPGLTRRDNGPLSAVRASVPQTRVDHRAP